MRNRTFNWLFWGIVAFQVIFVSILIWLGIMAVQEISEHGLKAVIEAIWNGPAESL